ncbi:MAG: LacI family DNA-binding transcriptional regulator [Oscillospiraceae bacterium]|nr:LacI family DNA-binding transcriptional regulator [Oscillospiraceae bacterium]
MPPRGSSPTMKDVAREAGVSLGTVSKVVNGIPVGKSYQKKVEAAIQKLNYRMNSYAKGLKSSRTNTIALLMPTTAHPFFGQLTYHINSVLSERGNRMILCTTEGRQEIEQAHIRMVQENQVDGIILLTYTEGLECQEGIPMVTIDRNMSSSLPCVACDNFAGGQLAAQKLADNGCRRLAYIGSSSPLPNEPTKRRDGFISTCTTLQLPYELCSVYDDSNYQYFYDFIDSHFHNGVLDFDGLFCCTDMIASRVISHLRQLGLRVPEDVQVIGFDGIPDPFTGEYVCSTIVQPLEQIAIVSVDLILSEDKAQIPPLICLPVSYGYGGTTKG